MHATHQRMQVASGSLRLEPHGLREPPRAYLHLLTMKTYARHCQTIAPAQVDMHELILAVCMLAGSVDGLALYGAPRVARRRPTRPRFDAARP